MQRFSRSAAGLSVAVLATASIAPQAVAAAQAPPAVHSSSVVDDLLGLDLGGVLAGLLGGTQQDQLSQLRDLLQSGTDPTGADLAPLSDVLTQLGGTSGLPVDVQALLQRIVGLLDAGGTTPLDPGLLAPVGALLQQLALTDGLPAPVAQLLDQLGDALVGDGTAGLPIAGALALPPAVVQALDEVLQSLESGGEPTGALLQPLIPLLQEIAGAPGLPPALSDLINELIDTLQETTGALNPLATRQLSSVLDLVGNTAGVDTITRTTIDRTTSILDRAAAAGTTGTRGPAGPPGPSGAPGATVVVPGGSGSAAPAAPQARKATTRDKAVVKKVVLNRKRTIASVTIACPKSAPAVCTVTAGARLRGKLAVRRTLTTRIGANKAKVAKLRLTAASARALRRRGGTVKVNLSTRFGTQKFAASKTTKVARVKPKSR
ncbi:hypothetical protein [Conexibacter sp. CPCC 206217]|uniref:hypothetical protein n=1 Tax=Conexibacter sp. CPCC 206217 TaxID=3064574 RepID=UPI00271DD498|nr:hypothetical protein [Conexibacter sp. CPCC 206217]MDO8213969.1 hypothetical protein [Conexibacter sp. CPCC 206217]